MVSQAIYGANVGIVEQKDGWARIRTPDDYLGWTPLSALLPGRPYAAGPKAAEVQSLFAHIYREASVTKHAPADHDSLREPPGSSGRARRTTAAGSRSACPTTAPDGCRRATSRVNPRKLSISETLEFSKRFLGLPYTWGGTSSYGYDCSGFSQMLGRRRGVSMPRDAQPQADWSGVVPVDRKDLQPGDLLYFGASDKKITHTGIYMGDGKFINATTHLTPMVRIDDLNDPYWTNLLVAARRLK